MTREFIEGYIYKISGLPYESDGRLVCNVLTEHEFLAYGDGNDDYTCFVISEADELEVAEGASAELLENLEIGYNENDGTAKFVVIEVNGNGSYLVASIC